MHGTKRFCGNKKGKNGGGGCFGKMDDVGETGGEMEEHVDRQQQREKWG